MSLDALRTQPITPVRDRNLQSGDTPASRLGVFSGLLAEHRSEPERTSSADRQTDMARTSPPAQQPAAASRSETATASPADADQPATDRDHAGQGDPGSEASPTSAAPNRPTESARPAANRTTPTPVRASSDDETRHALHGPDEPPTEATLAGLTPVIDADGCAVTEATQGMASASDPGLALLAPAAAQPGAVMPQPIPVSALAQTSDATTAGDTDTPDTASNEAVESRPASTRARKSAAERQPDRADSDPTRSTASPLRGEAVLPLTAAPSGGDAGKSSSAPGIGLDAQLTSHREPSVTPGSAPTAFAESLRSIVASPHPVTSSAASFPITVPFGSPRFGDAMGERVSWLVREGLQQAELTLNPPDMGPIRIELSLASDAASFSFNAPQAQTRAAIEQALPRLRELLAEQGLTLGQTSIDSSAGGQGDRDGPRTAGRPGTGRPGEPTASGAAESIASGAPHGAARVRVPGRVDLFA